MKEPLFSPKETQKSLIAYPELVDLLFMSDPPYLRIADRGGVPYIVKNLDPCDSLKSAIKSSSLKYDTAKFNQNPDRYPFIKLSTDADGSYKYEEFRSDYSMIRNPLLKRYSVRSRILFRNEESFASLSDAEEQFVFFPDPRSLISSDTTWITGYLGVYELGMNAVATVKRQGSLIGKSSVPSVYLNGEIVNTEAVDVRLNEGDLLSYRGERRVKSLLFTHHEAKGLFCRKWINGANRIIYNAGADFSMARPIYRAFYEARQRAADSNPIAEQLDDLDLELTIDRSLQNKLQNKISEICSSTPRPTVTAWTVEQLELLPASITVMDCFTGELIALATYPTYNPNTVNPRREAERLLPKERIERRLNEYQQFNGNLIPHVTASAAKPLLAVTALSSNPNLRNLRILHNGEPETDQVFQIKFAKSVETTLRGGRHEMDFNRYLRHSDNLYNFMLNTLALQDHVSRDTDSPRLSKHAFTLSNSRPTYTAPDLSSSFDTNWQLRGIQSTPWARNFGRIFDFQYETSVQPDSAFKGALWRYTAPVFIPRSRGNRDIMQEYENSSVNSFTSFRGDWLSFLLGSTFRLNNIQIAEAFSRIVTGKEIKATLIRNKDTNPTWQSAFSYVYEEEPLWRDFFNSARAAVMKGCKDIIWSGGTGRSQANILRRHGWQGDDSTRYSIGKTGTLAGPLFSEKTRYKEWKQFWQSHRRSGRSSERLPHNTLWVGVYGKGTIERPRSAYCLVVYAEARGRGYALDLANQVLPLVLEYIENSQNYAPEEPSR